MRARASDAVGKPQGGCDEKTDPVGYHHAKRGRRILGVRPGNSDIQLDLLYDYRTNPPLYGQFQRFFRERKPPTLIAWGGNDTIFPADGAHPHLRHLPDAEFHLHDSVHSALEDRLAEMAPPIHDFLDRRVSSPQ